jgi:tetratricopeptide (TPR) repeat protein
MEKFPLVGGSRLFADLAEGILALKQGEAANAEQRFRAALEFTEQQADGKHYGAAWASRWLASALQAEGRISAARAAADDAVRIWSQIYQDRSSPLLEARAYALKLSRQLPGVPPVP